MKVFLSWSGPVSKQVALAFREWLPNVIQAIEPWMSFEDIDKGSRWSTEIAKELQTTKAGIVCVTSDNHNAAWLNFEAGALSKTVEKELVCPFLFDLRPSDLTGPLVQFQAVERNRDDIRRMIDAVNKGVSPKPLSETKLTEAFDVWWPKLENKLNQIVGQAPVRQSKRPADEIIEEILTITREQAQTTQGLFVMVHQLKTDEARRNSNLYATYEPFDRLGYLAGLVSSNPVVSGIGDQHGQPRVKVFNATERMLGSDVADYEIASDPESPIKPE